MKEYINAKEEVNFIISLWNIILLHRIHYCVSLSHSYSQRGFGPPLRSKNIFPNFFLKTPENAPFYLAPLWHCMEQKFNIASFRIFEFREKSFQRWESFSNFFISFIPGLWILNKFSVKIFDFGFQIHFCDGFRILNPCMLTWLDVTLSHCFEDDGQNRNHEFDIFLLPSYQSLLFSSILFLLKSKINITSEPIMTLVSMAQFLSSCPADQSQTRRTKIDVINFNSQITEHRSIQHHCDPKPIRWDIYEFIMR